MKKILNILLYLIVIIIVLISLYTCYIKIIKKENMVFIGNYGLAVILSGSMEPTLSINDLVIVKKNTEYLKDDIIVYDNDTSLVVHRIVSQDTNKTITKGDANNTNDLPILNKNIKGKVVKKYSKIGKYIVYISNPVYISMIVIVVLMIKMLFKKRA